MIERAYIRNFKGIRECRVAALSKFNIFIGKNNSCKSTIIEAIHAALSEFGAPSLGNIIPRRSNVSSAARELWFNYDTRERISIQLTFNKKLAILSASYDPRRLGIDCITFTKPKTGPRTYSGPRTFYNALNWSYQATTPPSNFLEPFATHKRHEFQSYIRNSRFIDSSSRNDLRSIEQLMGEIRNAERAQELGKLLYEIYKIGPDWEFRPHTDFRDEYRVAIKGNGKYILLDGLGDGIRFALMVLTSCLLSNVAAIFIEEPETNQHPASMRKILEFLVKISIKNNLQIFVTTHNPRLWRELEVIYNKTAEKIQEMQCYLVSRNSKDGSVNCKAASKRSYDLFVSEVEKVLSEIESPA